MRRWIGPFLFVCTFSGVLQAKIVVFWEDGFPTVDSQPVSKQVLSQALQGMDAVFAGLNELSQRGTLQDSPLLVLPYGSAMPADAWGSILDYLRQGGNLLNLGGRPLCIPVFRESGKYRQSREQNTYSRQLGIWHSYEVPQKDFDRFIWDAEIPFFGAKELRARRVFVAGFWWDAPSQHGLAYFLNSKGERVASPVVRADFLSLHSAHQAPFRGTRCLWLNFDPSPGYWESQAGTMLIHDTARYASQGAGFLKLEMLNSTLTPGELPQVVVHWRNVRSQRLGLSNKGVVRLELRAGSEVMATAQTNWSGETGSQSVVFANSLKPGVYEVRAFYEEDGKTQEAYCSGFWVRDEGLLKSGPSVTAGTTYLQKDGKPYLSMGTNYFSTDLYHEGFPGGNSLVWERDFAEMEMNGITFVRTGVWSNQADVINNLSGGVEERFLRGLEAYLHSAARHHIHVHFTFYAFDPHTVRRYPGETSLMVGPGTNPYTDPVAIRAQQNYVLSIVERFKNVTGLSWDLINEPSFSNPKRLWKGNTPNADPTEFAAWNKWLEQYYQSVGKLAEAWNTTSEELKEFGSIPLPALEDLDGVRYGNTQLVRALDYNLFAQEMFRQWVSVMISAIRSTGSRQLVVVGQDEGGVSDRVLNQFYGDSGVAFTVNHTWWRDDALLWDSVVAKRPGVPNLVGETGVQPAWRMDTSWRWDEVSALGLYERKLVLGLAAANTGSLQWDWAQGDTFGIKRGDGSNKLWQDVLSGIAQFAKKASPYLTGVKPPEVAIVLPQSLQLSVFNPYALEAQQKCIRALYHDARASAYVVGEYQIQLLGQPKLIIIPSPWIFTQQAWNAVLGCVRGGSTLLVSGRFDADEHFHPVDRQAEVGISCQPSLLITRENMVQWAGEKIRLSYSGDKCTYLERAILPDGQSFLEKPLGKGKILFCTLPLELNDDVRAVGSVYRMALKKAGVAQSYSTNLQDPGILICPTSLENATLYALTSESSSEEITFRDQASGKEFASKLAPGRAALLLIDKNGQLLASYNWNTLR